MSHQVKLAMEEVTPWPRLKTSSPTLRPPEKGRWRSHVSRLANLNPLDDVTGETT